MELYNPKDIWHRPYFLIRNSGVYRNRLCALSEKDYESLCDTKGVNPIYPSEFATSPDPKPPKKITPRPPKGPKYQKADNVYDRIKKRRDELGITI